MTNCGKDETSALPISAADLPALRDFLRGYFHQDMRDEYSTVEAAVGQFCRDADREQRHAVANEWKIFVQRMKDQPLDVINRTLTQNLGSAHLLANSQEVASISAAFAECLRR